MVELANSTLNIMSVVNLSLMGTTLNDADSLPNVVSLDEERETRSHEDVATTIRQA